MDEKKNLRRGKRWMKAAAVFMVIVLLAGAGAAALRAAMTLYNRLSKKLDYVSGVVYDLSQRVEGIQNTVSHGLGWYEFDYSWTEASPDIAHAFGGVNGDVYTNSYEAFYHNYEQGHRVFEVDFGLTEPEWTLVCMHDAKLWREQAGLAEDAACSYDGFMDSKLYGRYTPMDYRGLIELMVRYPDVYVVTDTKTSHGSTVALQFAQLVKYAEKTDASVLDRIIPQIYDENMLDQVMGVYPFKSVIYTLYATEWNEQSVLDFCKRSGVGMVTLWSGLANERNVGLWKENGVRTAVHTVDNPKEARDKMALGVEMIYTDFLTPDDLR